MRWILKNGKRLERFDWKGRQGLPSGWSFRVSRRLEYQEVPLGWNFKSRSLLKLE